MRPWSRELAGRIDERTLTSAALTGNPLGDSPTRPVWIYLPPGYDDSHAALPSIYLLQGYGNFLSRWDDRRMFEKTTPELIDEAFVAGAPPCVVIYVDAWTALGGSQFLDSPAIGRYQSYLSDDVVSFVDLNYRTLRDPARRAVVGHSSGGYGAIVSALERPEVFGAFAAHSPDCAFWVSVRGDLALAHRALRDRYDSSFARFREDWESRPPMSRPDDFVLVLIWALSAAYSADPDGSVRLPFDEQTGSLIPEVWLRWLAHDPVELVRQRAEAARRARAIWIDAARGDEHLLDVAAEILADELRSAAAPEVAFTLYDGGHREYQHRFPLSIRYLAERMSG
jgi:pimeloyl-ACP methyl ester carboxylesterase